MSQDELTEEEKAGLLGSVDARLQNDYDERFYADILNTRIPNVEDLSDRTRRAITKYIRSFWEEIKEELQGEDIDIIALTALTEVFLKGMSSLKRPGVNNAT